MSLIRSFIGATMPGASILFSKTFLRIAIVVIITSVICLFGYMFYKDYKERKETAAKNAVTVVVQEKVIDELKEVNKDNAVNTETISKSGELTMTVVLDTSKIKQDTVKKTDDILKKKEDRKKQINQEFENSQKTQADVKAAELKNAENNINAMWDAYCIHSKDKTTQCVAQS